jgi:hypothetical protein
MKTEIKINAIGDQVGTLGWLAKSEKSAYCSITGFYEYDTIKLNIGRYSIYFEKDGSYNEYHTKMIGGFDIYDFTKPCYEKILEIGKLLADEYKQLRLADNKKMSLQLISKEA